MKHQCARLLGVSLLMFAALGSVSAEAQSASGPTTLSTPEVELLDATKVRNRGLFVLALGIAFSAIGTGFFVAGAQCDSGLGCIGHAMGGASFAAISAPFLISGIVATAIGSARRRRLLRERSDLVFGVGSRSAVFQLRF